MKTLQDEIALEEEMLTLGSDRVKLLSNRRKQGRMESLSKWGEALTAHGIDQIVIHLRAIRKKIEKGVAGKSFALLSPVTHLPPQQVAACALRTVIDSLSACPTLHSVAMDVADKLWIETMLDRATKHELIQFRRGRSRKAHKMAAIRHMQWTDNWQAKEKMASGVFLIELVAKETGFIEIVMDHGYRPARRVVKPTDQCMAWINDVKAQQELMTPNYLPMVIKPRPWPDGGYYKLPLPLMKSNDKLVAQDSKGDEPFIQAANIHQSVPWKVNSWMLSHIEHAYDNNLEIGCLLPRDGWPVEPYPKHLDEEDPGVFRWRKRATQIHEKNDKTKGARIGQAKTLWVARRFQEEEEIYFCISLDFRGRYYYRPPYLNPQGNDVSRSLLLFANGTPIETEEHVDWLRIHGANLYGLGKTDWQTRIDWVKEKEQLIMGAGNDPWLNAEFWMRADKPWCFLAFCKEYREFKQHGWGHICALPIMLDCTCSGIQHYAALLRSKEMGELVNLTFNDRPQDIYTEVINRVNEQLRISDDPRAKKWLLLQPDRSLAKPCVMTSPYSATRTAFYYYCYDWAQQRSKDMFTGKTWTTKKGAMSTMHFMAALLHKETTALIGPAVAAMEWFRKVGRLAGNSNTPLEWKTPSGLLVHQEYKDTKQTRIRLRYLSDVHMDIRANVDQESLDSKRMANSLSPHVVHSFDSSHMSFSTILATLNGVHNIGGVHDCFATTPSEMSTLRDSVRQAFSDMYSENWFERLTKQLVNQIDRREDLPTKPALGGLDLSSVRTSNYFIT